MGKDMNEQQSLKNQLESLQKVARERTVKTQTVEYDLETLVKKIAKGVIKLNPEYQRKHRWSNEASSRLVESLILNIPIPYVYISQDVDVDDDIEDEGVSRYSVIDGQQRLTAIYEFITGKFNLSGLEVLSSLNGMFYKDLPAFLVRRLEERTIKCLRIDSTLDEQVKYDIFERLNSGAVKLEAQELRNAVCRGPFKKLLKILAKNADFAESCNLTPDSAKVKKMEDEELVLRFFAINYADGYKTYTGKFKKFLTDKMSFFNTLPESELKNMEKMFIDVFERINSIETPFAKYKIEHGVMNKVSTFNVAVFDAVAHIFYSTKNTANITQDRISQLFTNERFFQSCEGSINDTTKVKSRIEIATKALF